MFINAKYVLPGDVIIRSGDRSVVLESQEMKGLMRITALREDGSESVLRPFRSNLVMVEPKNHGPTSKAKLMEILNQDSDN